MKSLQQLMANKQDEKVINQNTDSWGRVWGKIEGTNTRVWLTYAISANGTWIDDAGNYHFNAH